VNVTSKKEEIVINAIIMHVLFLILIIAIIKTIITDPGSLDKF
jgi:hypothetical protein